MVLFGCPTITTLEQLRFQFYTNGNNNFGKIIRKQKLVNISKNDSDRNQFTATDQKNYLNTLSIQGFGYLARKISKFQSMHRATNTFQSSRQTEWQYLVFNIRSQPPAIQNLLIFQFNG
jgi:hypothetical protein